MGHTRQPFPWRGGYMGLRRVAQTSRPRPALPGLPDSWVHTVGALHAGAQMVCEEGAANVKAWYK